MFYTLLRGILVALALLVSTSRLHAQPSARTDGPMKTTITITIAGKQFAATLADTAAAEAFKQLLPLSMTMSELNGNEKLFRLSADLPRQEFQPSTIQTGDLMLYSSRTVVLFYKSFPTVYSYTRIGRIEDPAGLAAAVGAGSIPVRFEATQDKPCTTKASCSGVLGPVWSLRARSAWVASPVLLCTRRCSRAL
jgi:hypothetical protein